MNNSKIIPSRIKEARESNGLSMNDLSEIVGVTSSAISEYEKGRNNPSIFVLKKISNELNFPINFFYKPIESYSCSNSAVYFRAMKTTSKKIKTAYTHRIKWAHSIFSYFKKYIEFAPIDFPTLPDEFDLEYLDDAMIEEIALYVRKYWELDVKSIQNVTDLIENKGVFVCGIAFKNRKIEAFSQWYDGIPYIFLGSNRMSCVSLRFSLAHEIGHLLLHSKITIEQISQKEIFNRIEDEANKFAAAFLMPAESFSEDLIHTSLDYFIILKEKWKVSISSMIKRAEHLGILSENQTSYLYRQLSIKKFWKEEPLDKELKVEQPTTFKDSFELLIDNKILTKIQILDDIALSPTEIINICSLENDYFNEAPLPKMKKTTLKIIE